MNTTKKTKSIMHSQKQTVELCLSMSLKIIRLYDWLLDLYVLDFFVENHWEKLPVSWRKSFDNLDPQTLGKLLSGKQTNHMFPLSFLALIKSVNAISLSRVNLVPQKIIKEIIKELSICGTHPKLKNIFLKHVKLKKRHEISLMAEIVNETAKRSQCNAVIDFGSGLGHLVRMLAYKYDLHATGIECQQQLVEEARSVHLVHAYRAALERVLVLWDPKLRHSPVRSIKHSDSMTFEKYCSLAVEKLNIPLPCTPEFWSRGHADLEHWRRVVTVYTLRLALAPLVETVVLLDRMLFVMEQGFSCEIYPVFDPKLSPRNHIIIARR